MNFREAILIANDATLTKEEKNSIISVIKARKIPMNYISPS
jgi:hypothetical protein